MFGLPGLLAVLGFVVLAGFVAGAVLFVAGFPVVVAGVGDAAD